MGSRIRLVVSESNALRDVDSGPPVGIPHHFPIGGELGGERAVNHSGNGRPRSRAIDFAIPRPVPTTVAETDDVQMAIRWDVSTAPDQIYSSPESDLR